MGPDRAGSLAAITSAPTADRNDRDASTARKLIAVSDQRAACGDRGESARPVDGKSIASGDHPDRVSAAVIAA
jgi:hypothetical protein